MGGNIDIDAIEVALLRVVMLCVDTAVLVCFLDRVGGYFRDAAAAGGGGDGADMIMLI